jgi:U3 small nucleolar RNA-associated protein 19
MSLWHPRENKRSYFFLLKMKRKRSENEIEQARSVAREAVQQPTHKNVEALLEFMTHQDPAIVFGTMESSYRVFDGLLQNETGGDEDSNWVRQLRHKFFLLLLQYLQHNDLRLQLTAAEKTIGIIVGLSGYMHEFPNQLYILFVEELIKVPKLGQPLEEYFVRQFNEFDDLRYYFFKDIARLLKKSKNTVSIASTIFAILSQLEPARSPEDCNFASNSELKGLNGDKQNLIITQNHYRIAYSECWLAFLTLPFDSELYQKILEMIHKKVMPSMTNPSALMDFMVDAYNSGGLVSILALNGLFQLMHKYNLDYPHFYTKLYALLDRNILHSKYRSRFFRLTELFMSADRLPTYLVAAFIKKLVRLCLYAPPGAIVIVLPFVFNLFRKHPSTIALIHKENHDSHTGNWF